MNLPSEFINTVFNNDVMEILRKIPDDSIDMIYGDPDYNVGINYAGKVYTSSWDEYINWYINLTKECVRVLKPTGNMFMINYPKQNAYLRVKFLDSVVYKVYDYVWVYNSNVGHGPRHFTTAHRSILHAIKTKNNKFFKENVAQPYKNPTDKRILNNLKNGSKGRMPYSWLYFDLVKNVSKDKTFHSCQIPLSLVEILIKSSTSENDNCFILFGGSGSEIVLCKRLKRNFISCEIHPDYYGMILDRLKNDGKISDEYRLNFIKTKKNLKHDETELFRDMQLFKTT